MLRINDILGWIRIRIRRSMPLTNGSGSGSCCFRHWPSRCQQKTHFLTQFFLLITFWSYSYIIFQKLKVKESQNSRNQGFSYYFCMMIEESGSGSRAGSGSGSIPLTSGSGSGRPKNMWIRIRNTDYKAIKIKTNLDFYWFVISFGFILWRLTYCTLKK